MFYNDEKKLEDFLIANNINMNHFDYLWRLFSPNSGLPSVYRLWENLKEDTGNKDSKGKPIYKSIYQNANELSYLVKRGFIEEDLGRPSKFPDTYRLTKGFFEKFTIQSGFAFEELYNTYPKYIKVNGQEYVGRNVEYDLIAKEYSKIINMNLDLHNTIISELKNQIELGMCDSLGMDAWIRQRRWKVDTIGEQKKSKPLVHGEDL